MILKKISFASILWIIVMVACACNTEQKSTANTHIKQEAQDLSKYKRAYFASGCFWCVEAIYESLKGVHEAVSGYAGGEKANPTYREVGSGETGHAEAVEVYYDPSIVSFETLVQVFYASQDPTTVGQNPDFGKQYRSIIFYQNDEEKKIAEKAKNALAASGQYDKPIVTEITALKKFYPAEEYHQNYEKLHPNEPYVENVSIPRLKAFQAKHPELLKDEALHK
ncbi:peptide-methionine (S)-S-oxide reductase MsrA [Limibacter armeniacum]|uniref:peptide-methionine (S)-S-oxide reductase MsrA n=1 Tax=Limibacter armeniacum TaxID=466084 RepID=UPI002FE54B80